MLKKNIQIVRISKHLHASSDDLVEFRGPLQQQQQQHLAKVGRVFGPGGSLEQAGGDGRRVLLDQLPEAGGGMGGSRIRSLALLSGRQVELLGSSAGGRKTECVRSLFFFPHTPMVFDRWLFTWPGGTWQPCWRCSPPGTKEGSWSWLAQQRRRRRGTGRHHLQAAQRESSL